LNSFRRTARLIEIGRSIRSGSATKAIARWCENWGPESVLVLVTSAFGLWAAGRWLNPASDPGFAWSLADRVSRGERLYRDIFLSYTPLTPYLLALASGLFGPSPRFVLLANWIPAVIAAVLLLRCSRRGLSPLERFALVGVVLSASLVVPGDGRLVCAYYPGVVHALAFSLGAMLLLECDSVQLNGRSLLGGVLAGLAFCCKQEIGVAALLALGLVLLTGAVRPVSWCVRLLAGFVAVVLPAVAFALSSSSVDSLLRDSHLWPLSPSPPAPVLHLIRHAAGLDDPRWAATVLVSAFQQLWQVALLALAALLLARDRRRVQWAGVLGLVAVLAIWSIREGLSLRLDQSPFNLWMSVAFLVSLLALVEPRLPSRPFLVAFGTFAGLVGLRTAFSSLSSGHFDGPGHLASGLTWVFFFCVFVPRLVLGEGRSAVWMRRLTAVLILCVTWPRAVDGLQALRTLDHVAARTPGGIVFLPRAQASLFDAIGRHAASGETALIIPESDAIDVLFHLRNVSPLIDLIPGWLDSRVEEKLIERLDKSPPDVVIIMERPFVEYGIAPFGRGYGIRLADWCDRNYRIVESGPAGRVLRRRE